VESVIDEYSRDWTTARKDACTATRVRGEQSEALLDLRMACLDRHLDEVRTLGEVFERGEPGVVQRAAQAALSLSPLEECAAGRLAAGAAREDEASRKEKREIAEGIGRGAVMRRAGEFDEAEHAAEKARDAARTANVPSLEAAALAELGRAKGELREHDRAEPYFFDAFAAAERAGSTRIAADVAINLAFTDSLLEKPDEAGRWLRLASAAIDRLGGDRLLEIDLARCRTSVLDRAAKYAEALDAGRRAVELAESGARKDPLRLALVLAAYGDVLFDTGDIAGSETMTLRVLAIFEKELGPDHPRTGVVLSNLGVLALSEGHSEEALAYDRRALAISEKLGPSYSMQAQDCDAIGQVLTTLQRYDEARTYLTRALSLATSNPGFEKRRLANLYVDIGDLEAHMDHDDEARRAYEHAKDVYDAALGPGRPEAAPAWLGLGLLHLKRGRPRQALEALEMAMKEADRGGASAPQTRLALARALWQTGGDRGRARMLAKQAEDEYAKHPAQEDGDRDLEQWLRVNGVLPPKSGG
jgi:tetratricopeptide (TPR) repeat protein